MLAGHQALPGSCAPLRDGGANKGHLAGPYQWTAVEQAELGLKSGASLIPCWPNLTDPSVCISVMLASRPKTNTSTPNWNSLRRPALNVCFRKSQRCDYAAAGAHRATGHLACRGYSDRGPPEPAGPQQRPHHAGGGGPARPVGALRGPGPGHRYHGAGGQIQVLYLCFAGRVQPRKYPGEDHGRPAVGRQLGQAHRSIQRARCRKLGQGEKGVGKKTFRSRNRETDQYQPLQCQALPQVSVGRAYLRAHLPGRA